jgi:phospholipid N-methyltransferase
MESEAHDSTSELESFKSAKLWEGGFMDADPLVPLSWSSYTSNGFVSIYYAMYMAAIRPYMPAGAKVLEIGPGHGAWTRALIKAGASRVYALDVQSREFNGIDRWLKEDGEKLEYFVVDDCSCSMIADQSMDFFWSFGAFVHMSAKIQSDYIASAYSKLKAGSHGFIQYADMDIWNSIVKEPRCRIHDLLADVMGGEEGEAIRTALKNNDRVRARDEIPEIVRTWDVVAPGRYYYVGKQWMTETVAAAGFEVIDGNFMENMRDPVVHFRKA